MTLDRQMIEAYRQKWDSSSNVDDALAMHAICDLALAALDMQWVPVSEAGGVYPKKGIQIRHVCGSAGYGHPNDVCPACEAGDNGRATPSGEEGTEK